MLRGRRGEWQRKKEKGEENRGNSQKPVGGVRGRIPTPIALCVPSGTLGIKSDKCAQVGSDLASLPFFPPSEKPSLKLQSLLSCLLQGCIRTWRWQ